jgi:hypothetical protein
VGFVAFQSELGGVFIAAEKLVERGSQLLREGEAPAEPHVCLAGIIHKQRSCGILPHNREERQDAAATNGVYE